MKWLWSCTCFALSLMRARSAEVELISSGMTNWTVLSRVGRCPIHDAFDIQSKANNYVFTPPGGGKFSVVEARIPDELRFSAASTGLKITYSAAPGATGVSLWRIRVSYS